MHFMATYFPVLIDCAFRTSENVPSPSFLMSLYSNSNEGVEHPYSGDSLTVHIDSWLFRV